MGVSSISDIDASTSGDGIGRCRPSGVWWVLLLLLALGGSACSRAKTPQLQALEDRNPVVSDLLVPNADRTNRSTSDGGETFLGKYRRLSVSQEYVPADSSVVLDDVATEFMRLAEAEEWTFDEEFYGFTDGRRNWVGSNPNGDTLTIGLHLVNLEHEPERYINVSLSGRHDTGE